MTLASRSVNYFDITRRGKFTTYFFTVRRITKKGDLSSRQLICALIRLQLTSFCAMSLTPSSSKQSFSGLQLSSQEVADLLEGIDWSDPVYEGETPDCPVPSRSTVRPAIDVAAAASPAPFSGTPFSSQDLTTLIDMLDCDLTVQKGTDLPSPSHELVASISEPLLSTQELADVIAELNAPSQGLADFAAGLNWSWQEELDGIAETAKSPSPATLQDTSPQTEVVSTTMTSPVEADIPSRQCGLTFCNSNCLIIRYHTLLASGCKKCDSCKCVQEDVEDTPPWYYPLDVVPAIPASLQWIKENIVRSALQCFYRWMSQPRDEFEWAMHEEEQNEAPIFDAIEREYFACIESEVEYLRACETAYTTPAPQPRKRRVSLRCSTSTKHSRN